MRQPILVVIHIKAPEEDFTYCSISICIKSGNDLNPRSTLLHHQVRDETVSSMKAALQFEKRHNQGQYGTSGTTLRCR